MSQITCVLKKYIHHETVRELFNIFENSGDVRNEFNNKRQEIVANDVTEFNVGLSEIEYPKYSSRRRVTQMNAKYCK